MANSRKIRGLTIEFGADAQDLLKGFSKIQNAVNKTTSLYKDMDKMLKLDPKNLEVLTQKQQELNKVIDTTKDRLSYLKNEMTNKLKTEGLDKNSDEFKALRREIIYTERQLESYQKELEDTNKVLSKTTRSLKEASEHFKNLGNTFKNIGSKMADVGKTMALAFTAPIALGAKKSLDSFRDFEDGLTGVAKTTTFSKDGLKEFGKEAQKLARRMPQTTSEIFAVAEAAGQLGIKDEDISKFTETMLRMGQATNLTAEEAAITFAELANIMGTSSKKFENMGSSVVHLGNNFATTESKILEMSKRLAGTGRQVGLTEANVFSLATALSSMGVEAQAGGSSVSRVMQKINAAVIKGGDSLKTFAKTAGLSAKDFSDRWKEDPIEALALWLDGIEKANKEGKNTIDLLKSMEVSSIRETDAVFRLAGNTKLLRDATKQSNKAFVENVALLKESELRNKTLTSRLAMLKNKFSEITKDIGERLVPYAEKAMNKISKFIDEFDRLDDKTKNDLIKIAGMLAVGGPILIGLGKIVSGVGSIFKGFSSVFKILSSVTGFFAANGSILGGIKAISTGIIAFGAKLLAFATGPGGIALAAITGITVAGIALTNHMSKEVIPTVDLFGKGVSESSKKAVGAFLDLEKIADTSLKRLVWSGNVVTKEGIEPIISNFSNMRTQIVSELEKQKIDSLAEIEDMFSGIQGMAREEKSSIIQSTKEMYDKRIEKVKESERRIKEILELAKEEKRNLTMEEATTIALIRNNMKEEGVKTLTESEEEYKIIMQRMKDNATDINAKQASEIVQKSAEQKEKTIAEAEKEYNERIRIAENLKAQGGTKAEEAANKIIEEARKQRDNVIRNAEEMNQRVVEQAKQQAKDHVNEVNWETGAIKTKWQQFCENIKMFEDDANNFLKRNWEETKITGRNFAKDMWSSITSSWELGTNFIRDNFDGAKNFIDNTWNNIIDKFEVGKQAIKKAIHSITGTIRGIWGNISWVFDKIGNFFKFDWVRLPKVNLWTEKGLLGIPIPKFSISWNAQGGIFKNPTVLPTLAGLQGFAEPSTGGEAIMPLNKLPDLMAEALEKSTYGKRTTIINYVTLDGKIIAKEVTEEVDSNLSRKSIRTQYSGGL